MVDYITKEKYEYLIKKSKKKENVSIDKHIIQIIYNEIFGQMTVIEKFCVDIGVKHSFLKGYLESYDLYDKLTDRLLFDIDVLVESKGIVPLIKFLIGNGYKAAVDLEVEDNIKRELSATYTHHIIPLRKKIAFGQFELSIEVHTVISTPWHKIYEKEKINLTNIMLGHSKKYDVSGKKITALDVEDRIITAMHHFSRHLLSEVSLVAYDSSIELFNFKTLIDAVLLWEKYKKNIKIQEVYKRVEMYGFKYAIKLANRFIKATFNVDMLDNNKLNDMQSYNYIYWEKHIYKQLFEQLCPNIVQYDDYTGYYKKVIDGCISENASYECRREFTDNYILINNDVDSLTKKRFGSIYRISPELSSTNPINAKIYLKWDSDYLYLNCLVNDKIVKYIGGANSWSDSLIIYLYNPDFRIEKNNAVTSLMFSPVKSKNGVISVHAQYCGEEWDAKNGKLFAIGQDECNLDINSTGYYIELKLSWKKLDIDISNINYIGFDVGINNVDSNNKKIASALCWSNPTVSYYMPAKFGIIRLINSK